MEPHLKKPNRTTSKRGEELRQPKTKNGFEPLKIGNKKVHEKVGVGKKEGSSKIIVL